MLDISEARTLTRSDRQHCQEDHIRKRGRWRGSSAFSVLEFPQFYELTPKIGNKLLQTTLAQPTRVVDFQTT
jgi:hypothetical protein